MTKPLRSYDYVNHPYEAVRDALRSDARGLFQRATTVTAARADALHSQLHARIGPLDVAAEVEIEVGAIAEEADAPNGGPATRLTLSWQAVRHPGMNATLSVYALTPGETQLDLEGHYEPPAGAVGRALDAVAGHRLAEASVQQFVKEIATALRAELGRRS